jgi:hypothetical protein
VTSTNSLFAATGLFTAEILKDLLSRPKTHPGYILTDQYRLPSRDTLSWLARHLNTVIRTFYDSPEIGENMKKAKAAEKAIDTLMDFFKERMHECAENKLLLKPETLEAEQLFSQRFWDFITAFINHPFTLPMDLRLQTPELKTWHDVAPAVAHLFKRAMNTDLGLAANDGPVARFVYAVIPSMTGQTPKSIQAVGQCLKRCAHKPLRWRLLVEPLPGTNAK